MNPTLEALKNRNQKTIWLLEHPDRTPEGRPRITTHELEVEGGLPFVIRRVKVPELQFEALRAVFSRSELVRWAARYAKAGQDALAEADDDHTPSFEDDGLRDEQLDALANKVSVRAILQSGLIDPPYSDAQAYITDTAYEDALAQAIASYSGSVHDPKVLSGSSVT